MRMPLLPAYDSSLVEALSLHTSELSAGDPFIESEGRENREKIWIADGPNYFWKQWFQTKSICYIFQRALFLTSLLKVRAGW
jgi:hypothetical protein